MIVIRKEKETNQQVLRRFNRIMQSMNTLQDARDKKEFVKKPNRFAIKQSALRREGIRRNKQWY
jgi:ribosomal protein S21